MKPFWNYSKFHHFENIMFVNMLLCSARDFDVKIAILGEASTGLPALPQASLTKLLESFFRHTNKILYDLIQVIASSSLANVESSYFHNVTMF